MQLVGYVLTAFTTVFNTSKQEAVVLAALGTLGDGHLISRNAVELEAQSSASGALTVIVARSA